MKIIERTSSSWIIDNEDADMQRMAALYNGLSEEEKSSVFEIVKGFKDQGYAFRLYFEFLFLHFFKDKRYAEDILSVLLTEKIDTDRKLNYYTVLGRELFLSGIAPDYSTGLRLEKELSEEVISKAGIFPEWRPYDERDRGTVVIVMRPFLGEYHSPSLQTINLDHYLRKLGFKTFYISYSDNELLKKYARDICTPFTRSVLYSGIGKFESDCFDMKIEGLHFDLRADTAVDDLNALAVHISQIDPEFVIGIEGGNILADICTGFTDVITMNVVDDLPLTAADSVLRYFPGEYKNGYKDAENLGKTVFDAPYDNELMPYNTGDEQIDIPADGFHICIMGNRLDDEIDEGMLDIIKTLAERVSSTDMVFIGDCPKTEEKLRDLGNRCRYLGYVERCEDAVGACSLFLNPPRRGGGGGGYMAIKRGVPVYTLGNCDVASCVGKEFEHGSYEELIPFVKRCTEDKEYYESLCDLAKENFRKKYHINSMENISAFCVKYREYMIRNGEVRGKKG